MFTEDVENLAKSGEPGPLTCKASAHPTPCLQWCFGCCSVLDEGQWCAAGWQVSWQVWAWRCHIRHLKAGHIRHLTAGPN